MERFFRLCQLHKLLLGQRVPVTRKLIERDLDCSQATAKRVLKELRDLTRDPIPYDRNLGGYRYRDPALHDRDLPFVWFGASELNALLVIGRHLETLQPRLLGESLQPLRERAQSLLSLLGEHGRETGRRVRILPQAHRPSAPWFALCTEATLQRRKLRIFYAGRSGDAPDWRDISPQRLAHYRDNWYVDAWCHRQEALRCFAVERIREAERLPEPAIDISDDELNAHFADSYGIFAGPAQAWAVLRFSPARARWVAEEIWHPRQRGRFLEDGRYELALPYGDPTELVMDILRQGPEVEVLEPEDLRQTVRRRVRETLAIYEA